MNRLKQVWTSWRESLWFVPTVMVASFIMAAIVLIELDVLYKYEWLTAFPRIFGAGADGSRGMLSSIAGSMITVAGLTFSLTIVAMSQVASQYTSRILRHFMRDRHNQFVLGFFVGIFAYCLVVLRTIRGGDEGTFIPSLAVFFGLILAVASIAVLIFYIHHIASSIQAATIIERAAEETTVAVKRLFPEKLGEEAAAPPEVAEKYKNFTWKFVESPTTGFVQNVDSEQLLDFAKNHDCVIRMERGIGDFVNRRAPLAAISKALDEKAEKELVNMFSIGTYRTIDKDAAFGVRQLVDIALKALSPGVNDTTTAVLCVNYLGAILSELADRRVENPVRKDEQNQIRVFARGAAFRSLLDEAFDQIRDAATDNPAIYLSQLNALVAIAEQTKNEHRRNALNAHTSLIAAEAARTLESEHNRERVRQRVIEISLKMQKLQASEPVQAEKVERKIL